MKFKVLILFFLLSNFLNAQVLSDSIKKIDKSLINKSKRADSLSSRLSKKGEPKEKVAKITDYLIISRLSDTTYVDTTLTIQKDYKFNYLRKDNFGLIPFSNLGQTYNRLSKDFRDNKLMPNFGARARHFNYMEIEDVNYYHVPTPLTELFFRTAFEQGQLVDAFFTVNTSKQLNVSIAYKGLRSLGKYQHLLTSTGNFRVTTSYKTKNKRYVANAHIVMQDLLNEENGGLRDDNIPFFETGDPEFLDRAILEVNFQNAENILKGKRFHLDHKYHIINKDSISSNTLNVQHIVSLEDKYFQFDQTSASTLFGDAFETSGLRDRVTLENFHNQVLLNYSNKTLGELQFNINHNNYNYGYDKLVVLNNQAITNRLKGDILGVGGKYKRKFNNLTVNGGIGINVTGDFDGNYIMGKAAYQITEDINLNAEISHNSKAPNYNYLLYQSDYINYNWLNNFNNIETQQLSFQLSSNKIADISVDFSTISDHTYFMQDEVTGLVRPFQNEKTINYLKVKLNKEIKYKKFTLNNTILYQNVEDANSTFNVPEIVTRNTLYYSNHFFKKALYLQTGITFNYFSEYNMNAYDPILAEFYTQNTKKYGGFPRLDFFINAKVQQTRIYLKAEHFNSAWTGYDFYSAPNYPYRDFAVRFGLVWNFFL